jgi:hypothetical protein
MDDVSVTIAFPTQRLAELFMGWMSDGGGEQYFYDVAAEHAGVYLDFTYQADKWLCRVREAGRVVDDDDPELFG